METRAHLEWFYSAGIPALEAHVPGRNPVRFLFLTVSTCLCPIIPLSKKKKCPEIHDYCQPQVQGNKSSCLVFHSDLTSLLGVITKHDKCLNLKILQ